MKGPKMCLNLAFKFLILIILTLINSSEARNIAKHLHPSAVIVGTVLCNTCFQHDFSRGSHFISGATVSVECKGADASFEKEVETDSEGKFRVRLPFSISKHEKKIKGCQVRLVKSSEPYCAVASTASSSSIHLKSRKQGTRVFSAGFFTFKPLKQPDVCNQKPVSINQASTITRPQFFFPPVFPSPPPAIGGVPLPPNPLQPPPLVPFPFPPNPLQPPSPPAFGLPPIPGLPGLIPPPPPPPPVIPGLPIPPGLPRLPTPPGLPIPPIIPGVPPAKKASP